MNSKVTKFKDFVDNETMFVLILMTVFSVINARYQKNLQNHATKFVLGRCSELLYKYSNILTAKYQRSRLLTFIK